MINLASNFPVQIIFFIYSNTSLQFSLLQWTLPRMPHPVNWTKKQQQPHTRRLLEKWAQRHWNADKRKHSFHALPSDTQLECALSLKCPVPAQLCLEALTPSRMSFIFTAGKCRSLLQPGPMSSLEELPGGHINVVTIFKRNWGWPAYSIIGNEFLLLELLLNCKSLQETPGNKLGRAPIHWRCCDSMGSQ